jgi:hypothetical protein
MVFQPTRAALDRPKRTIHACELIHAQAGAVDRVYLWHARLWRRLYPLRARRSPGLECQRR